MHNYFSLSRIYESYRPLRTECNENYQIKSLFTVFKPISNFSIPPAIHATEFACEFILMPALCICTLILRSIEFHESCVAVFFVFLLVQTTSFVLS